MIKDYINGVFEGIEIKIRNVSIQFFLSFLDIIDFMLLTKGRKVQINILSAFHMAATYSFNCLL